MKENKEYDIDNLNINEEYKQQVMSSKDYMEKLPLNDVRGFLAKHNKAFVLIFILFLITALEYVTISGSIDNILTLAFAQSVATKFLVIGLPYVIYLKESMAKAQSDPRHLRKQSEVEEVQNSFETEQGYAMLEDYTEYRAEELRRNTITERLRGSGISLEAYLTKYEMLCKREILENQDLYEKQKKVLLDLEKHPVRVKKAPVDDIMSSNENDKPSKNGYITDGNVKFEKKRAVARKTRYKLMKVFFFAIFWASIMFEAQQEPSFWVMATWIMSQFAAVLWAVWGGSIDGIDIIMIDKMGVLENKKAYLGRAKEWIKNGCPEHKEYVYKEKSGD